jgi:hypothetical protein
MHVRRQVLHRDLGEPFEALRMVQSHLMDVIVAFLVHDGDGLGLPILGVAFSPGGDDLDIHSDR